MGACNQVSGRFETQLVLFCETSAMNFEKDLFFQRASAIVGGGRVLTSATDMDGYQRDWRERYRGDAIAVVFPGGTDEVVELVSLCDEFDVAIVPQGGNTGLTGGAIATGESPTILLNMSRMNRILNIDIRNNSITIEAGCILENLRSFVEGYGRLFPMLLGSVGSCEIGGLISTNAGGTGVLRYGNMRDLVLGLEVVLPDGQCWRGLRALRKDNTGYDLKQLFIGAEGTLGIITTAVLKLFPALSASATSMVSLESVEHAIDLLRFLQNQVGNRVEAFEIMSREQLEIVTTYGHELQSPMPMTSPWYVLLEIADSAVNWDPIVQMELALEAAMESGLIIDAVVATDQGKANKIWELRHNISEANKKAGFTVSSDTAVPISQLPIFINQVNSRISVEVVGARVCHCGHIGDGNIHVIAVLSRDVYTNKVDCEEVAARISLIVHEESVALEGTISAEHGIGKLHVERLEHFKPPLDLRMMTSIKRTFDPRNRMNPGKVIR
jgi:FAD/FMN-containing dehydrogenase